MLPGLISFCLSRRPLVLISFAAFLAVGYAAFTTLNIEAYPDPAPPIIEIIAQYPGQSPEEMERYVTIPLEIAVSSTPGLRFIRSNTVYALSFIRIQFEYGRDYYFVRQQVINRLKDAVLPPAVQPVISPAGGISEIFRYQLKGPPEVDVMQLKTLQDWVVERRLRIVPGVADVLVLGGRTKEFQAEIDLNRMIAHGLTLPQIITAMSGGNSNVGGRTIAIGEQSVTVRGIGVVGTLQDIRNIVLAQQNGVPVLLSDVAKVQIGFMPRLGIAGRDDVTDIVTGIVLMQKFERTSEVVARVRAAIERLNTDGTLPPGVKIDAFYDRGDLVAITVKTVMHNMFFGVALIFLIQWMFLGNLRCALIVSATIPVALFLAVIITVMRGESANLLSVGAIDLGIIVDATVIMVENIFRHLAHDDPAETANPDEMRTDKLRRILNAAVEVDKPIFFSVIITIAAFLPLFTMQGVEGQIFGPMSRTYAYALIGAVIATFTVTPVMASILLPAHVQEVETILVRYIRKLYQFVLPRAVRHYRIAATIGLAFLLVCGFLGARLGTEFLPKLEEGNLWIRALLPPTITLGAGMDTVGRMRNVIKSYPPVRTVVSEQGRARPNRDSGSARPEAGRTGTPRNLRSGAAAGSWRSLGDDRHRASRVPGIARAAGSGPAHRFSAKSGRGCGAHALYTVSAVCAVAGRPACSASARAGITMRASVGITSRLQMGDSNMPPTTTQASGCCTCAPMPVDSAAGTRPMQADRPVMKICRMRVSPARIIASSRCMPSARFLRM
jgi:cobalt-zinc-cadmium resistance protein CzcA